MNLGASAAVCCAPLITRAPQCPCPTCASSPFRIHQALAPRPAHAYRSKRHALMHTCQYRSNRASIHREGAQEAATTSTPHTVGSPPQYKRGGAHNYHVSVRVRRPPCPPFHRLQVLMCQLLRQDQRITQPGLHHAQLQSRGGGKSYCCITLSCRARGCTASITKRPQLKTGCGRDAGSDTQHAPACDTCPCIIESRLPVPLLRLLLPPHLSYAPAMS